MKIAVAALVFVSLSNAHSGVWKITFDSNEYIQCSYNIELTSNSVCRYPGRDARIDDDLGAKRVEWHRGEKVKGNPWSPVTDVLDPAITCN
jgi:hypothetical protein